MVSNVGIFARYHHAQAHGHQQQKTAQSAEADQSLKLLLASLMKNNGASDGATSDSQTTKKNDALSNGGPCCGALFSAGKLSGANLMQLATAKTSVSSTGATDKAGSAGPQGDTALGALTALLNSLMSTLDQMASAKSGDSAGAGAQSGTQTAAASTSGKKESSSATAIPLSPLQQALFKALDTNGDGTITKSEMEQAVIKAGGTAKGADALYAKLDPNSSGGITAQQLAQNLPVGRQHHHDMDGDEKGGLRTQLSQSLFQAMDGNGNGTVTQKELEQAVANAGGTAKGADALYSLLDPNNTGGFTQSSLQTLI